MTTGPGLPANAETLFWAVAAVVAFRNISARLRLGKVEASRARIVKAADGARH